MKLARLLFGPLAISSAFAFALTSLSATAAHGNAPDAATLNKLAKATVPFVPNAGQWDERAAFAAQTLAGTVFVTKKGDLIYSLPAPSRSPEAVQRIP